MTKTKSNSSPEIAVSASHTVSEARRIAQPSSLDASWTDAPYRAVSIYPSMVLAQWGVSANQLTIAWIVLGIAGVVALGSRSYSDHLAGAVLLEISYFLDFVDGEVARLSSRTSSFGYLLDLAGHGIIKTALFLAIGYALFASTRDAGLLILSFLACVGIANGHMIRFLQAEAFPRSSQPHKTAPQVELQRSLLRSAARRALKKVGYLCESPGLYLFVLLGAIFNRLDWVVVFYGILGPIWLVYRLARFRS